MAEHLLNSSENQFVIPPLRRSVSERSIPRCRMLPPKGGTTNCNFHSFRASQCDMNDSCGKSAWSSALRLLGSSSLKAELHAPQCPRAGGGKEKAVGPMTAPP